MDLQAQGVEKEGEDQRENAQRVSLLMAQRKTGVALGRVTHGTTALSELRKELDVQNYNTRAGLSVVCWQCITDA